MQIKNPAVPAWAVGNYLLNSGTWTRTMIPSSRGMCPAIRRSRNLGDNKLPNCQFIKLPIKSSPAINYLEIYKLVIWKFFTLPHHFSPAKSADKFLYRWIKRGRFAGGELNIQEHRDAEYFCQGVFDGATVF